MSAADKIEAARALIEPLRATVLWQNANPNVMKSADLLAALADLADAQAQEIARLKAENERLNKMLQPEWFYPFDGCDGEATYDNIPELLDEHYFWDRPKIGQHVVKVEAVTTLPSIWAAVRFDCTCADPDDCECDNDMIVTEHASEAEARAALGETP
mgnify:CR=1 FL=1